MMHDEEFRDQISLTDFFNVEMQIIKVYNFHSEFVFHLDRVDEIYFFFLFFIILFDNIDI